MWKNIWPILVLGVLGYAYYTGWNPVAGWLPEPRRSPGTQAGGPAVVREVEQMPQQALQEMPNVTGSAAGPAQAARQAAQQAAGGNR
jgi:hypothetical protein